VDKSPAPAWASHACYTTSRTGVRRYPPPHTHPAQATPHPAWASAGRRLVSNRGTPKRSGGVPGQMTQHKAGVRQDADYRARVDYQDCYRAFGRRSKRTDAYSRHDCVDTGCDISLQLYCLYLLYCYLFLPFCCVSLSHFVTVFVNNSAVVTYL